MLALSWTKAADCASSCVLLPPFAHYLPSPEVVVVPGLCRSAPRDTPCPQPQNPLRPAQGLVTSTPWTH
ncbi:hypothetical protein ACOMHN_008182 [Nucella lapillus]